MKGSRLFILLLLLLTFGGSFAFANAPADDNFIVRPDDKIVTDIAAHFRSKVGINYAFNNVNVSSNGGNVVLTGQVRDGYVKDRAEEAATEVEGVRTIVNKIEVLRPSAFDDRLRVIIYRRLANDGALFHYFIGIDPAINIIVNGSRVTLVGVVNSRVDKARALSQVRQLPGVLSVTDQLVVSRS
jgi:osmotically-inducible protein OsmY